MLEEENFYIKNDKNKEELEKEKAIAEKEKAIAEKEKAIAELIFSKQKIDGL